MEGRVMRRSVTLADQLAAVGPPPAVGAAGSCNLRDLLKLRDGDDLAAGRRAAVTLASAMAAERQASLPPPSSSSAAAAAAAARTLLDIIRDDQQPPPAAASGAGAGDPALVRRAVLLPAPSTAASPFAPAEAAPSPAPPPPPRPASQPPTLVAAQEEVEQGERVSLMALLEQTDRQWSAGAAPREEDLAEAEAPELVEDDADADAEPEAAGKGVVAGCCCVCMARAKGAAFIPCGHTFCRPCARELLAGRSRCPLCNAAIVDVLDIF
ncbi:translation initiation factor IF-2-like [Panicum virgatum]|uniref:RING-type domain-containing protein n=1 Tax=Panicum virgatum TaxID=38727 RepID=A0A8T0R4E5_PANVG|nr:translation initiation factor IF-2-like [Panicum virgatum]KAG2580166.1 hypothetical protein PVAP13_6NG321000 [Panicum virgatum]